MKNEKIALFDLDCTLADFDGQMRRDLERLRSPLEPPIGLDLWAEKLPHIEARMSIIKSIPGWWAKLPKLQLGFDILDVAEDIGFDLAILTKGPSSRSHTAAWGEKRDWVFDNLISASYAVKTIVTDDKSGQYGRVLVDDYGPYLDGWLEHRPRGLGIIPGNANNAGYSHPQVVRYDGTNIAEVRARLQEAFDR